MGDADFVRETIQALNSHAAELDSMSKATRSTLGRVVLMWLPIGMFFALGFEHTVVNMWLFPTAILSGAHVSFYDWWVWNQIPVTIGNILGAMVLNGTLWYYTHTSQK